MEGRGANARQRGGVLDRNPLRGRGGPDQVCALTMIGRSEHRLPRINLVETAPPGASRTVEAYVTSGSVAINLLTSSPDFREVARSRYKCEPREAVAKLASVLVHEEWHLRHGPDERGAYSAQLTALAALGFDAQTPVYGVVKRSMLARLQDPIRIAKQQKASYPQ